MSEGPFQARTVTWIAIVAGTSFALAIALAVFGPEMAPREIVSGPSAYSSSALGHAGLVDALERLGVPVVVSRHDSARKARASGVLVIAEPHFRPGVVTDPGARIRRLIESSEFTLLVLPKRQGARSREHPGWVTATGLLGVEHVEAVLEAAGIEADIRHVEPESVQPVLTRVGAVPTFEPGELVQVINGPALWPLATTNGGASLLVRVDREPGLYILADPDPISNADFHRGENVRFFLRALNSVRDGYESVVFDETVHGFESSPTIWRELFAFPLVLVPIHLALLLALTLWAGMGRFGTPRAAKPPLDAGTPFLVDRTAALLRFGETTRHALPRYLDVALRDARRTLDAPPTLKHEALEAWLDRIAENRGVEDRVADLRAAVGSARGNPHEILVVADRIHRWKREIVHGAQ